MTLHDDDAVLNTAGDRPFSEVAAARLSRRAVMGGGMAAAAGFLAGGRLLGGVAGAAPGAPARSHGNGRGQRPGDLLGFTAIPLGYDDEVHVAPGYAAAPFIPWGTPILGSFPEFVPGTPPLVPGGNTAAQQAEQTGMHHDGMHYFPLTRGPGGSERGLLVVNHEYTDEGYLHTGTTSRPADAAWTLEMVRKSQNAHGVSVVEIARNGSGGWEVVRSRSNRRITANTAMSFSGPAAGHGLVRTSTDPAGSTPLGTVNNCAHGFTPWGTYLTCEENFNGYFRLEPGPYDAEHTALNERYGVGGDRYRWGTHDDRFVVTAADPNEPNRFGWVVEIDPFDPGSTPVKRTALGRLKHEGAFVHVGKGGRVVVYMGDDQRNEYAYKFVSAGNARSLQARGRSPLDEGTLYVARFGDDGTGEWLPLAHGQGPLTAGNGFADQGDVLVKARLAATALGATPMDRPEWTSVDPRTGLVYLTLTNNTSSAKEVNAANPRKPNPWGHIIRWDEAGGDHAATTFTWDLFLLAGQGRGSGDGSTVDDEDAFGSPDGLWVDPDGRVWIQTDGRQPAGANDQMLAANPYVTDANGAPEIKRFLTGVPGCEVTGVITTPDQRTMFVNIQHPGQGGGSTWPHDDAFETPRSGTVVVTRTDGGVIGT
jgi:secreted PhoX family phosphatase